MTRYEDRSKAELMELAAEKNIEGRSSMSKDELAAALRGGSGKTAESAQPAGDLPDSGPGAPGTVEDPNNPDNPTNVDPEHQDTPPDVSVGEAPGMVRTDGGDPDRVHGPGAVPLEQR